MIGFFVAVYRAGVFYCLLHLLAFHQLAKSAQPAYRDRHLGAKSTVNSQMNVLRP